jgi:predicted RNA-binding Zn-ribbon protein involved in translation (DUF1610 family)
MVWSLPCSRTIIQQSHSTRWSMEVVTTISTAYSALKKAKDGFSSYVDGKAEAKANAKVTEAMKSLGEALDSLFYVREELFRLQDENRVLKEQLSSKESWNKKLSDYKLVKTTGGATVYESTQEPKHFACPNCIEHQEIQILQSGRNMAGTYNCPGCKTSFPVDPYVKIPPSIKAF